MFRLLVNILLVGIPFGVVNSYLIREDYGERIEGDKALYSKTQITNPTVEPTIQGVVFDWVGLNETFTQVVFEMSSYHVWLLYEHKEFVPPYLHSFTAFVFDLNITSLIVTITVYGFSGQTHLDVHPFETQNSLEPVVNMFTKTRNRSRKATNEIY